MNRPDDSPRAHRPADDSVVETTAADWHARRDAGLTPEQERELARWLAADPRHADAFAELGRTWALLDGARAARPRDGSEPDPALLVRPRRPRRRFWAPAIGLAAAAAVACAVYLRGPSRPGDRPAFVHQAATAIGGQETIPLPDGSTIRLNTHSAIDVSYASGARRVRLLRGEAHFTVAKDPLRPFVVMAGKIDVQAVGTAFNVRLRPEAVEVVVTAGRVKVDDRAAGRSLLQPRDSDAAPVLSAGERVVLRAEGTQPAAATALDPAGLERAIAWQDRRLEFSAVPLHEVVAEFNRYNRHQLVIADPQLAARKFGGIFRADGYEALVHLLEQDFGVTAQRTDRETVLRLAR